MIIALTMDRCGSSLLMQTLKCLGVPVSGKKYSKGTNEHHAYNKAINPKGFYEDGAIFRLGLNAEYFSQVGGFNSEAHKISTKTLTEVGNEGCQTWIENKQNIEMIFIPFRQPLEQAHSYLNLMRARKKQLNEFIFITQYLRHYQRSFYRLAQLFSDPLYLLKGKIKLIHYQDAFNNPWTYVENLINILQMNISKELIEKAVDNIELALYRSQVNNFPAEHQVWAEKIGATQAYRILCESPPDKLWENLLSA